MIEEDKMTDFKQMTLISGIGAQRSRRPEISLFLSEEDHRTILKTKKQKTSEGANKSQGCPMIN